VARRRAQLAQLDVAGARPCSDQAQNALIKLSWLERALERGSANPVEDDAPSLIAGVDVGGGEAETVVYLCASKPGQHKIIKMGAWRGEDTRGEVVRFLAPYCSRLTTVRVDDIGIGHNFGLHLRDPERFVVELVNVSLPCQSRPQWYENDPVKRFANRKAQFYQTLADAFEHDQIDGLTDDETIGQLADIMYEIDPHGRMKIEPKEKARRRGVRSPDRAEALMLALGKPSSMGEIILVPTNPSRAQSHPIERIERAPYETSFVLSADQSDPDDPPQTSAASAGVADSGQGPGNQYPEFDWLTGMPGGRKTHRRPGKLGSLTFTSQIICGAGSLLTAPKATR
jgi:hypothetical protein